MPKLIGSGESGRITQEGQRALQQRLRPVRLLQELCLRHRHGAQKICQKSANGPTADYCNLGHVSSRLSPALCRASKWYPK